MADRKPLNIKAYILAKTLICSFLANVASSKFDSKQTLNSLLQ